MTELIWEGKYYEGKRVAPLRIALPFQTVETVNESAQQRQMALDMFSQGRPTDWKNRLIWGDKRYVLPSLLDEFAGKVNLIYIDPPFNVGADFSYTATIADHPDTDEDETSEFLKRPSLIEQKAYRDTWGRGMESYLQWFYETIVVLRDLLAENGSVYVHLDWHVSHYAKSILDEVFGIDNFVNEIVWRRTAAHNDPGRYGNVHDVIFFYTKNDDYTWNPIYSPYTDEAVEASFSYAEAPDGTYIRIKKGENPPTGYRRFQTVTIRSPHPRPNLRYEYKGYQPHPNGWSVNRERMEQYDREGKLFYPSSKDGALRLKMYLDDSPGVPVQDLWTDVKKLEASSLERLGYDTQKPEALLERIIKASSNENDLVLDCFCGSGTTVAVAEKLNRRWITCDLGRFAIHTARKRLLGIEGIKPFVVQNLGKYERQAWQNSEFKIQNSELNSVQHAYRKFILDLYHAKQLNNYTWLHGVKGGRMVHVGSVDAPVTAGDLANIAAEFKKAVGTGKDAPKSNGVDILGWDFAFELNEVAKQQAAQANLDVRFYRVPRDVMDKRAVEQGDIHFFELAALKVEVTRPPRSSKTSEVSLTLADFVIPPDDVPQDVQKAIKHWSQWVDYWAVDWDFKGDTFHNQWQTYRTRKNPDLQKSASHVYEAAGEYTVVVKVIDILGNDTTKTLKVKV